MAYKLNGNVIASGTQVQHMAGEIVDIPDPATANSLIRRGLAESVNVQATHVWGESNGTEARGGKSVAQKQAEVPQVNAAAPNGQPDGFPQKPAAPANQAPVQSQQPSPEEVAATAASVQ